MSELETGCPNFGWGVRTLDGVSELWTGCPIFELDVRILGTLLALVHIPKVRSMLHFFF